MCTKQIVHKDIIQAFRKEGHPEIAEHSSRFFKTAIGEYGEGDRFIGIRVPVVRTYAKKYKAASPAVVRKLLKSEFHEERLLSVILLVEKFKSGSAEDRKSIYEMYMDHTAYINNWDIIDTSAPHIVGAYLKGRNKRKLYDFARSDSLWERRIAIMATFHYIRQDEFETTLEISELLVHDKEDLIHKAVGWMLREIGKRDRVVEERFLKKHVKGMPRTMLRYAIEKFPEIKRKAYLNLK